MQSITTIGLDIAKSVFQVHGVDANGKVVKGSEKNEKPRRSTWRGADAGHSLDRDQTGSHRKVSIAPA